MIKKIVVVGCGKIFQKHLEAIKIQEKKGNLKLIAVCDKNLSQIKTVNLGNIKKYTNINEMIKNEKFDIVSILTPSGYHYQNAIQFAGKAKSIIIEKPLTLKISDAKKLTSICDKKGSNIYIVLQNRLNDSVIELKKAINQNLFGKIFMITVRLRWSRDLKYYSQSKWRGTWKLDGGVVANQSAHFIDLFQWLFGMPKKVFSKIRQMQKIKKEVEDTALAIFEYNEKNKLGLIEATNAIRPKNLEGSISVIGEKGTVVLGGMNGEKIINWTIKKNKKIQLLIDNKLDGKDGHIRFYDYVIKNFKSNKKNSFNSVEAIKGLKIINSIYKSANLKSEFDIDKIKDTHLGK